MRIKDFWNKSASSITLIVLIGLSFVCSADDKVEPVNVEQQSVSMEQAVSMDSLRRAINNRQYTLAYRSASLLREEHEGEPEYDFLLGLSALETGDFHQAVFALERFVANFPDQLRARLELGRAYYASQNYSAAKQEFEFVLAQNPPPNVRQNVLPFLQGIKLAAKTYRADLAGYVGLRMGFDTNTNSATDDNFTEFSIREGAPVVPVLLTEESQALEDTFAVLDAGLVYSHPVSRKAGFAIKLSGTHRDNFDSDTYDIDSYTVDSLYQSRSGYEGFSVNLRYHNINLDDEAYQQTWSLGANRSWDMGSGWLTNTGILASSIVYPDAEDRDVYQAVLSASIGKQFGSANHTLGLAYSNSSTQTSKDRSNGKDAVILTYAMSKAVSANAAFQLQLYASAIEYDTLSLSPYFGELRKDDQASVSVGWRWLPFKDLLIEADIGHTLNNSNIDIYQYDRSKVELGCRYRL